MRSSLRRNMKDPYAAISDRSSAREYCMASAALVVVESFDAGRMLMVGEAVASSADCDEHERGSRWRT